jgi:chitinase
MGDSYAATERTYTAAESVDGVADTWDQPLRGTFHQLRELKKKHPGLKVLWSFGGWTWSTGFGEAARNPAAFAQSCYDLVENSKWADVFDGIDIDWEYPNACGATCDTSGRESFKNLMAAVRAKFGSGNQVTAAITADATSGGKTDAANYAGAAQYVDWYNPMTYDFSGAWDATGPTAAHSALNSYSGIPKAGFHTSATIAKLKASASRLPSCCSASASTAAAGPASPSRHPAAPRPGRRRGPGTTASRTTRCSSPGARRPGPWAVPRTPSAGVNGGVTTPPRPSRRR